MDEFRKMLSNYPMLTEEEIEIIVANANIQSYKKGTGLLQEGQISRECYSVLKGIVREYYVIDGEEKTTAFFTEGQAVNSFTSYVVAKPSKHYLVCATDCLLVVGTRTLEEEMCKRIPKLEFIIRKEVEELTGKAQDEFAAFVTSTPEERYLKLQEDRSDLFHQIPQHQLASYLGITPESLSRIRKRIFSKKKVN